MVGLDTNLSILLFNASFLDPQGKALNELPLPFLPACWVCNL